MTIRIISALMFMWRLFCWQRKWLIVEKDLCSSAAYFKYYVTGALQVREKETHEGSSSPLTCLPLARRFFLVSTTSKHLLCRLYIITNYISRT